MKRRQLVLAGLAALAAGLAPASWAVLGHPRFGKAPAGERLARMRQSPHYANGAFRNLEPTPRFAGDASMVTVLRDFYLKKHPRLKPEDRIPVARSDLKALAPGRDAVLWFGHSSWFFQLAGRRVLIDPVFSDHAAPFSFLERAFPGTTLYSPADMPEIDCLLVSHDHWDHLDYATCVALRPKTRRVVCPLGLGAFFELWGFAPESITELDWFDHVEIAKNFVVHLLPARHYSARLLAKDKTLWGGFALEAGARRILFSGDSGYGRHFAEIGKRFGGFDLAMLDCGQYDPAWAYIHMNPEEASRAARDVGAKILMPTHVGRFSIANHTWDDPLIRAQAAAKDAPYRLATPKIGEIVFLDSPMPKTAWWLGLR